MHKKSQALSRSRFLTPLALALTTFIAYFPSRHYPFHFDDLANITQNFNIRTFNVWHKILYYRRWFGEWLNALIFQVDGFAPQYYRLANIGIHIIGGLLVFYLISWLCARSNRNSITYTQRHAVAGLTSALFLLHPVQTQTISYAIQGKLEGAMSVLMLASLACMLPVLTRKNKVTQFVGLAGGLLFGFVACGTKEVAIVLPALLLLIDWFFVAQQEWSSIKSRLGWHLAYGASIGLVMLHYFKPSFFVNVLSFNSAIANNRGNVLTSDAMVDITPLDFLISQFKVVLHYLWMFVWPFGLSVEYDWKLSASFFSPDSLLPFLLLVGIAAYTLLPRTRKQLPALSFGMWWFFVVMAPRTTIVPSQELVCDYKSYLASVGWLFVLAVGIVYLLEYAHRHLLATRPATLAYYSFLSIATLGLASGTYQRNQVWSSNLAFWHDVVVKAPGKARGHNNYGVELVKQGHRLAKTGDQDGANTLYAQAATSYKHAIALDNWYPDPYANIGVCYTILKQHDKAIEVSKRALEMFPDYPEAHNNLGTQYLNVKQYADAQKALERAIELRPHFGQAHYNLARVHLAQNNYEPAWQSLKNASEQDFDTVPECWLSLGNTSLKLGKYDEAVKAFEHATVIDTAPTPKRLSVRENGLANAYYLSNQYDKAATHYLALSKQKSGNTGHHHNLGECYFAQGDLDTALTHYQNAAKFAQCSHKTLLRLATCYQHIKDFKEAAHCIRTIMALGDKVPAQLMATCQQELLRINTQLALQA